MSNKFKEFLQGRIRDGVCSFDIQAEVETFRQQTGEKVRLKTTDCGQLRAFFVDCPGEHTFGLENKATPGFGGSMYLYKNRRCMPNEAEIESATSFVHKAYSAQPHSMMTPEKLYWAGRYLDSNESSTALAEIIKIDQQLEHAKDLVHGAFCDFADAQRKLEQAKAELNRLKDMIYRQEPEQEENDNE